MRDLGMTKREIADAIRKAGGISADAVEIHHAMILVRKARGDERPISYDDFRVALRRWFLEDVS